MSRVDPDAGRALLPRRKEKAPARLERGDHPRFRGKSRLARGRKIGWNIADTLFAIVNRAPSVWRSITALHAKAHGGRHHIGRRVKRAAADASLARPAAHRLRFPSQRFVGGLHTIRDDRRVALRMLRDD